MAGKATEKVKAEKSGKPDGLHKLVKPSDELAKIVGKEPLARGEVVSRVWTYIKDNNLQNPEDKREILADDKLEPLFGKKKATMFEMNKFLSAHLS